MNSSATSLESPSGNYPNVLVCFAVKEEAGPFRDCLASLPKVKVLLTGMAKKNAERAILESIKDAKPGMVLTCGFAGGVKPGLTIGTVFFELNNLPKLESLLITAGAQPGRFFLSDKILSKAEEKNALWQKTQADAVDMESQVIRDICEREKIPSATVRVILDVAEDDLPLDFNELLNSNYELDQAKLAMKVMTSPGKIPALMQLQKQSRMAAGKLAEVLQKVCASVTQ